MVTDACPLAPIDESTKARNSLYEQALRRLAQREYSEEELRRRLKAYTENTADIETVLTQLKEAGHLSDDRFIEAYIQSRVRRGFGPIRIRGELQEKGISKQDIEPSLAIWQSSWLNVAKRVIEKKYGLKKNAQLTEGKGQLATQKRFLLYRGFEMDIIQKLFTELSND